MVVARGGFALFLLIPAFGLRTVTQDDATSTAFLEELRLKKASAVEKINSQIKYNLEHSKEIRETYEEKSNQMTDAEIDKLKTSAINYFEKKKRQAGVATWFGVFLDSAIMVLKMVWGTCALYATIIWWAMGLTVLMLDNKLDFFEAFFLLGQQITTVGYGSHGPNLTENTNTDSESSAVLAIFHGLHALVATSVVSTYYKALVDKGWATALSAAGCDYEKEEKGLVNPKCQALKFAMITTLTLGSTIGFAFDVLQETDKKTKLKVYNNYGEAFLATLYMVFITMTTVGYGDVMPVSNASRFLSVPWMMMGTQLWARSWEDSNWIEAAKKFKPISKNAFLCEQDTIEDKVEFGGAGRSKLSGSVKIQKNTMGPKDVLMRSRAFVERPFGSDTGVVESVTDTDIGLDLPVKQEMAELKSNPVKKEIAELKSNIK